MRPILPALALLVAIASPGVAEHCETYSTSEPEITLQPFYVDNMCDIDWCPVIYVYEESNGIPGLQRNDEFVDDTCHGSIRSDTIIW